MFLEEILQETKMRTLEQYSRRLAEPAKKCNFHKDFTPGTRSSDFSGLRMRDARVRVPSLQCDVL